MKFFTIFILFSIIGIYNLKAQDKKLSFEKAVFYEYSGNGDGNRTADAIIDKTITIPTNKTLKITNVNNGIVNANGIPIFIGAGLFINDVLVSAGTETWLPAGTYTVKLFDSPTGPKSDVYKAFISGVQYNIEP